MHLYFENLFNEIGNDMDLLKELASDFSTIFNDSIDNLEKAIKDHNYYKMNRIAHKLKGASMNFNLPNFTSAAEKIEDLGKDEINDTEKAIYSLDLLKDEFKNFSKEITNLK